MDKAIPGRRIEALEKVLKDPHGGVRRKAAESLSRFDAEANFDTYARMLQGDDRVTRIQAIYLLGELPLNEAIELLRMQMSAPYDDVRAAVIRTLGNNADNYRAHEILEKAVDIAIMGLADANPVIRASAADVLAEFKQPRSVDALLALLANGKEKRRDVIVSVLLALGEIGDTRSVLAIIEKAETDNVQLKEAALKAMGMIGDPDAESCLIMALEDDDPRIRMQAAESLGKLRICVT